MLVWFSVAAALLVGMMGVAVDMGFVTLERRVLQKAADAAAMSGAVDLVRSVDFGNINTDVNTMVTRNSVPAGTVTSCSLVDNSNAVRQANCSAPTDTAISGVRVQLTRTRQNYFLQILGMPTVNVSATAIGRIAAHNKFDAGNAPFIVCGFNTELVSGGTLSILNGSGPYTVNPAAVGQTFEVHGPQVATCGAGNNAFKGLADMDENEGITTLPAVLQHDTGVHAGPTRALVNGPGGCPAGVDDNCVMILPIATSITGPPQREASSVMWLPFLIRQTAANEHSGQLLGAAYYLKLPDGSTVTWTVGDQGLVAARLVN